MKLRHLSGVSIAAMLMLACLASRTIAAEEKLSDLAYKSYKLDQGAVVIDTSGTAKLRISFVSPSVARVQIAPVGEFVANPSPAVAGTPKVLADTRITDGSDMLVLHNAGLTLHIDKQHLRVDAYDGQDAKAVSLEAADGTSWDTANGRIRHSRVLDNAEHIYGLGQDNSNRGTLDRRGTIRDLWTGQQIRSGNVTANYPVPFYLSTGIENRGYGCFVDNVWRLRFDLGRTQKDRLTWTAPGGPIDYYLINGPSFKTVIDQYTQLTGRPTMLPLWALGYWQSKCFYTTFEEINRVVDRLKTDGLPLDIVVIDANWAKIQNDFIWTDSYANSPKKPEEWLALFHQRGLKVIQSNCGPMIRPQAENYADGWGKGLFATDGDGKPVTCGYYKGNLLDFTNPDLAPWLWDQLRVLTRQGIDGSWLDLIEPEGEPPTTVYKMGKSADIHNSYALRVYRTYFDYYRSLRADSRPVILGRAASAGTQRFGGIVWSGDVYSDWPTFQAHIPEAQNSGLSGLPYWTNDSGGFMTGFLNNDRYGAHARLYERWFEFTCFAPITRAHKAGPSEPFQFGPEVEASAKKYLKLRYRLLPYIYNMMHECVTTGVPMLRPLVLEFQNDPGSATAKTQFMFGDDMLVAPVIWADATARQVYLPPGKWINFDEGFEMAGGTTLGVAAPHDRIPLFVRAGAILPTAPDMMYTGEKPWDPITLEVWPAGESTGTLFQDDGATTAFEHGDSTTTTFLCIERAGKSITFHVEPNNQKFGPKQWIAEFHLTSVPTSVALDGNSLANDVAGDAAAGWSWAADSNTLTVKFPGERTARSLEIALDGSSHPRPQAPEVDTPALP
jgi:alpha-glucosidase (family GH31 glycosyl hydrolase)